MEKMPDEIYAWMGFQDNGSWDREPCVCDSHESVKYIRADLADLSPQTVPAGILNAVQDAVLVVSSISRSKYRLVKRDGADCYWQTDDWVNWALDEILPRLRAAEKAMLAAAPKPPTEKLPHIEGLSEAIDHCETIEKELREYHQFPKSFVMQIPARPNADSDFMFSRLFKAAREYLKRMDSKE